MRLTLPVALLCIILFAGCKNKSDDNGGTLVLSFKPVYDGQPLPVFTTSLLGTQQLQFTHLSMMLADVALLDGAGEDVVHDIELVDLSFDNMADADEGYELTIRDIPAGTYTGLQFGIGVPADLNQMTPADFSSSSPLSKAGNYWVAWSSYIFMKIEGRMDTLGQGAFTLGFAYHTGSDELYRILTANFPLQISEDEETRLNVLIDYKSLLEGIDIKANPQNHNPSDIDRIQAITNRLQSSIYLTQ